MRQNVHPAHVLPVLKALATAPLTDRVEFARYVRRSSGDPFPSTLKEALRQTPSHIDQHYSDMPFEERDMRQRWARNWLDWEEAR
jgi:hypothetical protein